MCEIMRDIKEKVVVEQDMASFFVDQETIRAGRRSDAHHRQRAIPLSVPDIVPRHGKPGIHETTNNSIMKCDVALCDIDFRKSMSILFTF